MKKALAEICCLCSRTDGESRTAANTQQSKSSTPKGGRGDQVQASMSTTCENKVVTVMGLYSMSFSKEDLMGEGTSSICRKGTKLDNGQQVAIKVYKASKGGRDAEEVKIMKFKRQISVLKELQEPFNVPSDASLWNEHLANTKPSRLFMTLLDYSKDAKGEPGPDKTDGILYVVTELAQYSLKDYISLRRDQCRPLPKDSVRNITKAIILVVAGLHAKGRVHIDLKPENLMMFNGRLKLIDVDGCVKAGEHVSIQDSSISFSPCYCAPEWAKFLIEDSESKIHVQPSLDVWSVGMTICELVYLDALLKPMYANFLRNGHSHREAGFLFMEWLSCIKKAPLPKTVEKFDPQFTELLNDFLLVCDWKKRKSCAQALTSGYLAAAMVEKKNSKKEEQADAHDHKSANDVAVEDKVERTVKRKVDESAGEVLHKGTLFKLNSNGDPTKLCDWLQRDMWVASNGGLCYWSIKENKRLVMIDGSKMMTATITPFIEGARQHAFKITVRSDDSEADDFSFFACENEADYNEWLSQLAKATSMAAVGTMKLGSKMAEELKTFKLAVKNKRIKVEKDEEDHFAPVFTKHLWKVKGEGDRMKEADWFYREMWIAKNGSLVYYSKKEERPLVYYTQDDIARASVTLISNADSCKPWSFKIQLPASDGVEFAAGEFAAESEQDRTDWIRELRKFQGR